MLSDQGSDRSATTADPVTGEASVVLAVPDVALIAAAAAGNRDAFAALYDRYAPTVYRHCFRLSGSLDAAEELTAMTFLEAWRGRQSLHLVGDSAGPWLHGIARNVARNARRAARRHQAVLVRLSSMATPASALDAPARVLLEEDVRVVREELRKLPTAEREVIELCVAAELTREEAALVLGVPTGTVKSRLHRGLSRLRSQRDWGQLKESPA